MDHGPSASTGKHQGTLPANPAASTGKRPLARTKERYLLLVGQYIGPRSAYRATKGRVGGREFSLAGSSISAAQVWSRQCQSFSFAPECQSCVFLPDFSVVPYFANYAVNIERFNKPTIAIKRAARQYSPYHCLHIAVELVGYVSYVELSPRTLNPVTKMWSSGYYSPYDQQYMPGTR